MKKIKTQRNIWIFIGLCFLLSSITFLSDDKSITTRAVIMWIAFIASFINAYKFHKKM